MLIAAGALQTNSADYNLTSSELYDMGLGFTNMPRLQIVSVSSPLNLGAPLVITGALFRGFSEGSTGNAQDSSGDYPLVQLRSLESGQTTFLLTTNWGANFFASVPVTGFPPGYALATVFVNGIQSTSSFVNVSVPVRVPPTLTQATTTTNGFQFAFTNNVNALFGVLISTNISLPLTNWTAVGGIVETLPGQFQFTDPQATNGGQHFYQVYTP